MYVRVPGSRVEILDCIKITISFSEDGSSFRSWGPESDIS